MLLDQIDKIWTSVDVQLQPWALFEVSPVQLVSQLDDAARRRVVRPGGIALDVRAGTRPLILRVVPEAVRQGGRVRIDAAPAGDARGGRASAASRCPPATTRSSSGPAARRCC